MTLLKFFTLAPSLERHAPMTLFLQEEKNELFIGPHARLCGLSGMAHIESESLAQQYAEAIAPIFHKRYGNSTTLKVISCDTSMDNKTVSRIAKDSEIISRRLATNNFASNKAP